MLSFVCTRIGEQDDLLLPAWATSSFTTVAGKAGWRGVKPSLDALIDVAAVGSVIKAGASQRPMRIARLTVPIALADPTGEQSPPGYSMGEGSSGGPSSGNASASICSQRTGLTNLYQCLVRLARWRATEEFRMSGPDRLTSRDDTGSALDTRGLILRIVVVGFLTAVLWHMVVAVGTL